MVSADVLCVRSMEVEWENGTGSRQKWSSWTDGLCGWYEAEKMLPSSATDISVQFKVRTVSGPVDVCKVDRSDNLDWVKDSSTGKHATEVVWLRAGADDAHHRVDATFELSGPMLHCYVRRAWNSAADRGGEAPDPRGVEGRDAPLRRGGPPGGGQPLAMWERWDDEKSRPQAAAQPDTLKAADASALPGAGLGHPVAYCASRTQRLTAAAKVLQEVRRESLQKLGEQNRHMTVQWGAVNSTNTVSAGLGIAAAVGMFLAPPVGVALGLGSAAVGGAATAGDTVADRVQWADFRAQMAKEVWNTLAVAELEREWLEARQAASEALQAAEGGSEAVQVEEIGLAGAQVGVASAQLGAAMAKAVVDAVDSSAGARNTAVASSGLVRGAAPVAARVLGVAGAVLSTGVAVHGWSTTKPLQASVRAKIEELETAILCTQRWLAGVGELECSICLCSIDPTDDARRCKTWHYSHARCLHRWAEECRRTGRGLCCPLCNGEMTAELKALQGFLTDDIRSQLRETKA